MAKSIETIWKEGFIANDALIAPALNDLYERKSQLIADRLIRLGRLNLIGIAVMAVVLLAGSILLGAPYTGAAIFIMLSVALALGMKSLKNMNQLDSSLDCYHYLKSLDDFLIDAMAAYTNMYRFIYPALTLAILQATWSLGGFKERFMADNTSGYLLNGMPLSVLMGIVFLCALTAVFSGAIYRFDINLFYGRTFRKLRDILADMEALRN